MVLLGVKCCIIAICTVVPDFGSMCCITLSFLNGISEKNQTEQAIADSETLKTLSFPHETFQA